MTRRSGPFRSTTDHCAPEAVVLLHQGAPMRALKFAGNAVLWVVAALGLVSLVCVLALPETAGRRI